MSAFARTMRAPQRRRPGHTERGRPVLCLRPRVHAAVVPAPERSCVPGGHRSGPVHSRAGRGGPVLADLRPPARTRAIRHEDPRAYRRTGQPWMSTRCGTNRLAVAAGTALRFAWGLRAPWRYGTPRTGPGLNSPSVRMHGLHLSMRSSTASSTSDQRTAKAPPEPESPGGLCGNRSDRVWSAFYVGEFLGDQSAGHREDVDAPHVAAGPVVAPPLHDAGACGE